MNVLCRGYVYLCQMVPPKCSTLVFSCQRENTQGEAHIIVLLLQISQYTYFLLFPHVSTLALWLCFPVSHYRPPRQDYFRRQRYDSNIVESARNISPS